MRNARFGWLRFGAAFPLYMIWLLGALLSKTGDLFYWLGEPIERFAMTMLNRITPGERTDV